MLVVLSEFKQYLYDCWPAVQAQLIADAVCIREFCLAAKHTVCSVCNHNHTIVCRTTWVN